MDYNRQLRRRYLEAISSNVISLSLSNIADYYMSYIRSHSDKVESELERVGYFVLKNKVSIGNSKTSTKDIQICTYFVNTDMIDECNAMLGQKYHTDTDVRMVNGFFVPDTNELVVLVKTNEDEDVADSLKKSNIRATIEHELTHAFDNTNKNTKFSKQNSVPGVGENFLSMCNYFGCASRSDILELLNDDFINSRVTAECVYSISILLYKLFTITEFNAHQVSDVANTNKVNIRRSNEIQKALKKDILADSKLTDRHVKAAIKVTASESPELWRIVGNVLAYMGYELKDRSPNGVYKFFKNESDKLFNKYLNKKEKNQVKNIISLREKENIKKRLDNAIMSNTLDRGISFWFSPSGDKDSYLCRVYSHNNELVLTINNKKGRLYGNTSEMLKRALDAHSNREYYKYGFVIDSIVDVIVQSIERHFNNVMYDPVYDITVPQDEDQINKSNKIDSRFADLDWD